MVADFLQDPDLPLHDRVIDAFLGQLPKLWVDRSLPSIGILFRDKSGG